MKENREELAARIAELENALPACSPEEVDPVLRELARCKRRLLRTAPSPRRNRG